MVLFLKWKQAAGSATYAAQPLKKAREKQITHEACADSDAAVVKKELRVKPYRHLHLVMFFASVSNLFLFSAITVQAQTPTTPAPQSESQASSDDGWHVAAKPYIWFAGVHGTVGVLGREASVHASFSDVLSNLNIGAMGALEVRYNRIIMPVDFMWIKLSDNKGIPLGEQAFSIKVKMTETVLTPKIGYRFIDGKRTKVDVLVGIRYWHLTNNFALQPTQPLGGFSASADCVDVVEGGKMQVLLTPKVVLTVLGDAGAANARSDYQLAGLLGYKLGRKCILQAGYRYLSVNYRRPSSVVLDVTQSGLVLGATINLK
jgi:hypothetical protein